MTWLLWKRGSWHLYKYVFFSNLFQVFGIHVDFHESRSFCWWKTPRKKPVDISTQTIIPQPSTNQWLTMEKKLQSISISFGNHHHSPMIGKRQLPKNFRITVWCWEKSPPSMWRYYTFGYFWPRGNIVGHASPTPTVDSKKIRLESSEKQPHPPKKVMHIVILIL